MTNSFPKILTQNEIAKVFEKSLSNFRFVVGTEGGPFSSVWSAWHGSNDYYVSARTIAGAMKISLHGSGKCRIALVDAYAEKLKEEGIFPDRDRALLKWDRKPTPNTRAIKALGVIFPTGYMRGEEPKFSLKKPTWGFQAAPAGRAVEIAFYYSRENPDVLERVFGKIGVPIFCATFDSGERMLVVAQQRDFDPACLPTSDQIKKGAMLPLTDDLPAPGEQRNGLNGIFWSDPKDTGTLHVIDIGGLAVRNDGEQKK